MLRTATPNWLLYYRIFLAVGVIFFFFTRLDVYLTANELVVSPIGWLFPYFALVIPLFIVGKQSYPSWFVLHWCFGYFTIAVLSYLFFPQSEASLQVLSDRCFASIFLLVTTFLFAEQRVLHWTRYALLATTLIVVFNNFYQFLIDQSAFGGLFEGRARGIYLDPNDCASALILGMILTLGLFPQKFRIPWILVVGLGIAPTLSRGGILCWIVVFITLNLTRVIAPKKSTFWILGVGLFLFILVQLTFEEFGDASNQLLNPFERVVGMIDGSIEQDDSALERKGIAQKGWEMFLQNPIFGCGIGSTFDYSITGFNVSTHNTSLLYLAEYGFLGILILPLAIYVVTHHAYGETRKIAINFTVFILLTSLFSHTVLTLIFFLISFALMAAMSATSHSHSV